MIHVILISNVLIDSNYILSFCRKEHTPTIFFQFSLIGILQGYVNKL